MRRAISLHKMKNEISLIEPSGTPNSGDPETAAPRQWERTHTIVL